MLNNNNYNNDNTEKHYWAFLSNLNVPSATCGWSGLLILLVQKHASFDIPLDIQLGSKIRNISTKPLYHNNNLHLVSCLSTQNRV